MKSRSILTNTAALFGTRVGGVALGVVYLALASRYLGPVSYGILFSGLALSGLIMSVADLGVGAIAPRELARPTSIGERRALVSTLGALLWLSMTVTTVTATIVVLLVAPGHGARSLRFVTVLFLAAGLLGPVTFIGTASLATSGRGWIVGLVQITSTAVGILAILIATAAQAGFVGVLLTQVLVTLVVPLAFIVTVPETRWPPKVAVAWRPLLREALPMGVIAAINVAYIKADAVLLAILSTKAQVGLYGLAYNVTNGLISVPAILMLAAQPSLVRSRSHPPQWRRILSACFLFVQVIAVAVVAEAICFRNGIAIVLGGGSFRSAAAVVAVLVVGVAITFPTGVLGAAVLVIGRQRMLVWGVAANLLINVAANLVLIPLAGALGAAWAFAGTELIALGAYAILFRDDIQIRPQRIRLNLIALMALLLPCLIGPWLVPVGPTWDLFSWGVVGCCLYVVALWRGGILTEIRSGLTGAVDAEAGMALPAP